MLRVSVRRLLCAVAACSILIAALAMPGPASAQSPSGYGTRTKVSIPDRTDAGAWYGTWYYVSRDRQMALWIRHEDGIPQVKMGLRELKRGGDSFTTDWNGLAEYGGPGKAGTFTLTFDEQDENTLNGSWVWETRTASGTRTETADVTIFRAGWGRQLVWKVTNVQMQFPGDDEPSSKGPDRVWTFRKASRREALWGELPF
jgi:hypothetical protein